MEDGAVVVAETLHHLHLKASLKLAERFSGLQASSEQGPCRGRAHALSLLQARGGSGSGSRS